MDEYCQYCLPVKRRYHWDLKADYYMEIIRRSFLRPVDFVASIFDDDSDWLWGKILEFFALFGAVKFVADPPREQIFNRSLIVLDEAKKRGIEVEAIKIFGDYKNEYRYRFAGKPWRYFEANPLADEKRSLSDHKGRFKKLMLEHEVPVPEGQVFTSRKAGLRFADRLGYPVVVKPATGSLGYHSTYQIRDREALDKGITIAQIFRPDFVIEKHIPGENFRATVIGRKHVFVCGKDRSNVVGDGRRTISELIDEKNADPRRGEYGPKNITLHRIPKANLKMDLDQIPAFGQKVYFFDDFVPGSGIDFIELTERVHPENQELFLKAAKALNTDLVGFDLIAENMTRPYYEQTLAILEANSLPYLDLHQFPSKGTPSDVAKTVWDVVMEKVV